MADIKKFTGRFRRQPRPIVRSTPASEFKMPETAEGREALRKTLNTQPTPVVSECTALVPFVVESEEERRIRLLKYEAECTALKLQSAEKDLARLRREFADIKRKLRVEGISWRPPSQRDRRR